MSKRILIITDEAYLMNRYNGTHLPLLSIIKGIECLEKFQLHYLYEKDGYVCGEFHSKLSERPLSNLARFYLPSMVAFKSLDSSNHYYDYVLCMTIKYIQLAQDLVSEDGEIVVICNEPYYTTPLANRSGLGLIDTYLRSLVFYLLENIYLSRVDKIFVQNIREKRRFNRFFNLKVRAKIYIHMNT